VTATPHAVARIREKGSHTGRRLRAQLADWPIDDTRSLGELLERLNRDALQGALNDDAEVAAEPAP
jgi:hypothetical protein